MSDYVKKSLKYKKAQKELNAKGLEIQDTDLYNEHIKKEEKQTMLGIFIGVAAGFLLFVLGYIMAMVTMIQ